nr:MAG TPA: hypothetical protein [Caudoviricetes sp.]
MLDFYVAPNFCFYLQTMGFVGIFRAPFLFTY